MSPRTSDSPSPQESPADLAWSSVADGASQPVDRHTIVGHMQILLLQEDLPHLDSEVCADLQSVIGRGVWSCTVQSPKRVFNLVMPGYLLLLDANGEVVELPGADAASTSTAQESLFPGTQS